MRRTGRAQPACLGEREPLLAAPGRAGAPAPMPKPRAYLVGAGSQPAGRKDGRRRRRWTLAADGQRVCAHTRRPRTASLRRRAGV